MANAYWVSGGNGNINSSTNWSTVSGGPNGYTPVSGDDLIVDANSLNAPMTTIPNAIYESLTFSNYTGTFTIAAGTITFRSGLEYASGMTVTGTGGIGVGDSNRTTATINFNGVTHSGSFGFNNGTRTNTVYTITGDLHVLGTVSFANSNAAGSGAKATINGGNLYCYAGFSIYTNGNRWLNGTSDIIFVGGGSGNFTSGILSFFQVPIIFAKTGGTINMTSGAIYPRGITITYVSGNFTNFIVASNVSTNTFDTSGMIWSSFSVGGGAINLTSQLNVSGTFSNSISNTIGGVGGINCANLTTTGSLTLPAGSTTNISNTLTSVGTAAAPIVIGSSVSTVKSNMILSNSGNQDVAHTSGRDIDSDGGTTIMSYRAPSITRCDNWTTLPVITSINTNSILR